MYLGLSHKKLIDKKMSIFFVFLEYHKTISNIITVQSFLKTEGVKETEGNAYKTVPTFCYDI